MTLPQLAIKRHVLAWMLSAVIMLFGLIAYQRIGIDRVPKIEFPVIIVNTTLRGASPEVMDSSVTSVIESTVNTTPGIAHIQSSSSPGVSSVSITFDLDKDIDVAYNEVQTKVSQILRRLPQDIDPPTVQKVDTNASPVIWLALTGDRTVQQLNLYASNVLKKKFETISGVGEVQIGGRRDRVIRVNVLPERMAAYQVGANDILSAFNREHIQLPGGFVVSDQAESMLKLDLEFHRLSDLGEMIILNRNGIPIRLKDVAHVEDGITDNRQIARYNGKPAVGLGMVKIANANTVQIIQEVKRRLDEEVKPTLPAGMSLEISTNDSIFIQQMVNSLKEHLLEGTLFAALVVLLFMRSFSSTLMICLEIPVSLLGAIAVMYFSGYTFNSMTLLGLLLLIGVVVDDAIVVRESILRHLSGEEGQGLSEADQRDPAKVQWFRSHASEVGSQEVVFAVLASSLSLICIFAPVIFMDGIMGMFFKSFAVVVTFGVAVSLFVSLTLTPMLCSRYLSIATPKNVLYDGLGRCLSLMESAYARGLQIVLRFRATVLVLSVLLMLATGYFSIRNVEKDFVPETDESSFTVTFKTPLGSSLAYTDGRLQALEAILKTHFDVIDSYFATIGAGARGQVNQGTINIRLKPKSERSLSQKAFIKKVKKEFEGVPGVRAIASPQSIVRGQRSEKLQFTITGDHLDRLGRLAAVLQDTLSGTSGMGRVDTDVQLDLPQLSLVVDRVRASQLGLSVNDVATAVSLVAGGINVAKYNDTVSDGQRYDIRVKAGDQRITSVRDLSTLYLRNSAGQLVRLDAVAHFDTELGAAVIGRYDLRYAANFYANPSIPLGEAIDHVETTFKQTAPAGVQLKFTGQAEELGKTLKNVKFVFALGLVLLYMVLASQFNSFSQPFLIMLAQPLAIIGGLLALAVCHQSLNLYSMIGLVLLMGLVAKNSILLVDLTNQYRAQGRQVDEALLRACPIRLRPVLMTSMTIILALLPAAMGLGAGSETNQPLSVAIIGGMLSSTLLTLVVVPAAYSLVYGWREHHRAR